MNIIVLRNSICLYLTGYRAPCEMDALYGNALQTKCICILLGHKFCQKLNYLMFALLKTYHMSSYQGLYIVVDGNSRKIFASCQMPSCIEHKYAFNNSIAERLITICSFERFHLKQIEYITKNHIAMHILKT